MAIKKIFGYLAMVVLIFLAGYTSSSYRTTTTQEIQTSKESSQNEPVPPLPIKEDNAIYFLTIIETPKGPIQIKTTDKAINIGPPEILDTMNPVFKNNFVIEKNKYPKLFRQDESGANFVLSKVITTSGGKFKIEISNNIPDHGGYSPTYLITVDPITGEIKENTHPQRDNTLTSEETAYLSKYPHISDLVGNGNFWKLKRGEFSFGDFKLESLITVPITASNWQRLYIFDNNSNYIEEKGYEMQATQVGDTIEVTFMPNFPGLGEDVTSVHIYSVDSQTKKITKIREY